MASVEEKLTGGDRRSIGRVDEVVSDVGADQTLLSPLVDCLFSDDPVVRMLEAKIETGSPAVKSRGIKLLARLSAVSIM
jgi:hypothetical protein